VKYESHKRRNGAMPVISIEWWILYLLILGIAPVAFLIFFSAVDPRGRPR
jgi:hypothetical protein